MSLTVAAEAARCQETTPWPDVAPAAARWPHGPVATETRLQRVVRVALDRLQREALDRGEKFSIRRLETDHDLSQGTLNKLKSGERKSVELETAPKVAAALGIDVDVLMGRKEAPSSRKPVAPVPEPTPPPPTLERVDEELEEQIRQVWDPAVHLYADGKAVEAFRAAYGRLTRADVDPLGRVLLWLNTAAAIRIRGEKATPAAMLDEMMNIAQERAAERAAAATAAADAKAKEHGIEITGAPSAQTRALQEARKKRDR